VKAIRFKVRPTGEQMKSFDGLRTDLTRVWNLIHRIAMHNRSIEWFEWANKTSKKDGSWDFSGCSLTAIMLPKRHAYVGAACEIVRDGGWWAKDELATPIAYRGKKIKAYKVAKTKEADIWWANGVAYERMYKFPMTKWMPPRPGHIPRNVANEPFEYIRVPSVLGGGTEIKKYEQLDSIKTLKAFGIELPPKTSDYLGGLIAQFSESYKAWTDPKRTNAHKPRFRQPDDLVKSLYNAQTRHSKTYGCTAAGLEFITEGKTSFIALNGIFGDIELYDGERDRVPLGMVPRSYNFTKDASGYYIAVVFSSFAEVQNTLTKSQYKRFAGKADDEQKAELRAAVVAAQAAVDAERLDPGNGKTLGIDPGIKRQITAHDGEKTFHIKPAKKRQDGARRLALRVDRLKSKLSKMKTTNNIRLGAISDLRRSAGKIKLEGVEIILRNESKLQHRIQRLQLLQANKRRAYQHYISVRLFRKGYSTIHFEATQLGNMNKRSAPKLKADGKHAKNHGAAKSGLNKSLATSAMAAQSSKVEARFKTAGRSFIPIPAHNTSQLCHCCSTKGDRATQELFLCLNDLCVMAGIPQNADDNTSKNIYRGSVGVEPEEDDESTSNPYEKTDPAD
jgi:transposase